MMISDQAVRTRAIDVTESFIVQAPAGSGKTELLTQRILNLLAHAQKPEEVLAITFTRKAAQEMRHRVMSAIRMGLDETEPTAEHTRTTWGLARNVLKQDAAQVWGLLQSPSRLQVMTIDALCASLARQLPLLSQLGGMSDIAQDPTLLYEQAAVSCINDCLKAEHLPMQQLLLHLDNKQSLAVMLLSQMLASREQWLSLVMLHQQHDDLRPYLEANIESVIHSVLTATATHCTQDLQLRLKPLCDFAAENAEECERLSQWNAANTHVDDLDVWKTLASWLLTKEGELRKKMDKRQGFPAPSAAKDKTQKALFTEMKNHAKDLLETIEATPSFLESLQLISLLPPAHYEESDWTILSALLDILPQAAAHLLLLFQQRRSIDFTQIAQSALIALGDEDNPTDFALMLDYKIKHILVDEFQDTSITQFSLLEKLTSGWQPGDGRTLFCVGDPMQSIYRFRQAEVALFLQAKEQGIGSLPLTSLTLTTNFRSQAGVIDWINTHAPLCFAQADDLNLGAIAYSPSESFHEQTHAQSVMCIGSQDVPTQAAQVLDCIKALHAENPNQTIAILVRARSHLTEITQLLARAKVAYQAVELEPLIHRPVIQQLMILVRATLHPADSMAWLALLHAPYCGFSLKDITRIRESAPDRALFENLSDPTLPECLSAEGRTILKRIQGVLHHLFHERGRQSLAHTVRAVWIALGGPAALPDQHDLDDAQTFFETLMTCEQANPGLDFADIEREFEKAYSAPKDKTALIQVMTIHRAKGLEFDAVIMPALERATRSHDKPLLLWEHMPTTEGESLLFAPIQALYGAQNPLYDYLWATQKQKNAYELGRLLYVGLTRAKSRLCLLATLKQNAAKEILPPAKGSFLSLLWPRLSDAIELREGEAQASASNSSDVLTRLSPNWQWPRGLKPIITPLSAPLCESNAVDRRVHLPEAKREQALGTLVHRVLYQMAKTGLSHWDDARIQACRPYWQAALMELGVHEGWEPLLDTVEQAVRNTLADERGRWILAEHTQQEAELELRASLKGRYQRIIVDRTFIDAAGTRWIIDYKTSTFGSDSKAQYAPQLENYARILSHLSSHPIQLGLYFPLSCDWIAWSWAKEPDYA